MQKKTKNSADILAPDTHIDVTESKLWRHNDLEGGKRDQSEHIFIEYAHRD